MAILLLALGGACAAFAIWLAVRIVNRREAWAIKLAMWLAIAFALAAFIRVCTFIPRTSRQLPAEHGDSALRRHFRHSVEMNLPTTCDSIVRPCMELLPPALIEI